ncbi:hypothetical protein BT69DRAFT_1336149 [Atractiella rhizophila]|nr:hypothetical protein BT69DRAFT_1336149 [Atractiella rhizophila]
MSLAEASAALSSLASSSTTLDSVIPILLPFFLSRRHTHWFCLSDVKDNEKETLWDSAVFLLCLWRYKAKDLIADWGAKLERLLGEDGCETCIKRYVRARNELGERYLRLRYDHAALKQFYTAVAKKERTPLLQKYTTFPLPALIQLRILHDLSLSADRQLLDLLIQSPPVTATHPPEGPLLLLAFHESEDVRMWAMKSMTGRNVVDVGEWKTVDPLFTTVLVRLGRLYNDLTLAEAKEGNYNPFATGDSFPFSDDRKVFWDSLNPILPLFSKPVLRQLPKRFRQFILSHLGDNEDSFEGIVRCSGILMDQMSIGFWEGLGESNVVTKGESYPVVVLNRLLSNPVLEMLLKTSPKTNPFDHFLIQFLFSVPSSRADCLRYASAALFGTFQASWIPSHGIAYCILSGVKLWKLVNQEWISSSQAVAVGEYLSVLELHSDFLSQVAFRNEKKKEFKEKMQKERTTVVLDDEAAKAWREVSKQVAGILGVIMLEQAEKVQRFVISLSKGINQLMKSLEDIASAGRMAQKTGTEPPKHKQPVLTVPHRPDLGATVWKRVYKELEAEKFVLPGLVQLIPVVAAAAFVGITLPSKPPDEVKNVKGTIAWAGAMLGSFREGFGELLDKDQTGRTVREILSLGGRSGKGLIKLIFSPVEDVQTSVTNALQQSFDAQDRLELFRALFKFAPEVTLAGIHEVLKTFVATAKSLVEATGFSKRLVRCLNDVVEVLCDSTSSPKGFFHDMAWRKSMKVSASAKDLWSLMCQATTIIYERTQHWAPYYTTSEMVDWMRDVVAFQVVMVENIRAFQSVSADIVITNSPAKSSTRSSDPFVADLDNSLERVTSSWLRLNDMHLLQNVTDLICKVVNLFARYNVELSKGSLQQLHKYIDKGLDIRPIAKKSTLLTADQITSMLTALVKHPTQGDPFKAILDKAQQGASDNQEVIEILDDEVMEVEQPQQAKVVPKKVKPTPAPQKGSTSRAPLPPKTVQKPTRPLNPLNVAAKSTPQQLSSEDDTESEDEGGLAALGKAQKDSPIRRPPQLIRPARTDPFTAAPPRRTMMLDGPPGLQRRQPMVMTEQQRLREEQNRRVNRRNMCNKVAKEFDGLYRTILQWDPSQPGEYPPGFSRPLKSVAHTFKEAKDYHAIFHPLLMIECWQQILKAKEEGASSDRSPLTVKIADRSNVDDFVELTVVPTAQESIENQEYSEVDLIELSRRGKTILGKISSVQKKRTQIELKIICSFGNDVSRVGLDLIPNTDWELSKVTSLSTIMREYAALRTLPYLEMRADILKPHLPPRPNIESADIRRVMQTYKVNEPQAAAITGSLQTRGFSLIQGPPGTGKTSTIVGLVGAFLFENKLCGRPVGRKPKLLLCAPSNAAVDEVAKRLKDGVRNVQGALVVPKVVRIGAEASVNLSVKDIFVDSLVDKKLEREPKPNEVEGVNAEVKQLAAQLEETKTRKNRKREEIETTHNNQALVTKLEGELRAIIAHSNSLYQQLQDRKDKLKSTYRARDDARVRARKEVLDEADVICATLSGSGHDYMANLSYEFDTVIIDEAAQSVEISSLIPLRYGCTKCILVGDPNQLPPTVISTEATKAGYNNSIFVRLQAESARNAYLLRLGPP